MIAVTFTRSRMPVTFFRRRAPSAGLGRGTGSEWLLSLSIWLRGVKSDVEVPLAVALDGERLVATSEFALKQTELGLTPFSVMLGALQVADELEFSIRLSATRAE